MTDSSSKVSVDTTTTDKTLEPTCDPAL